MRSSSLKAAALLGVAVTLVATAVTSIEVAAQPQEPPRDSQTRPVDITETRWLLDEVDRLTDELTTVRHRLAETELQLRDAHREIAELRRFVADHEVFGDDFAEYAYVKAAAEDDARRRHAEEARQRWEQARAERLARREAARADRARQDAEDARLDRYRDAGFAHVGFDVFTGRMAYRYATSDGPTSYIDYDPFIGLYYRPMGPTTRVDYGSMTISGSVLNASDVVRNIGVAITFFDESGNQVGAETIQVENARPDVPYPFTATLSMALDRPFSSVSQYVLYADE